MAAYRTSAAGGGTSGTGNRTVTITPASGDLLVVYCFVSTNTNDTPTCTDDNSDGLGAYTLIDVANVSISSIDHRLSVFVRNALMSNTTSTIITPATGSNTSGVVVAVACTGITRLGAQAVRSKGLQNNQSAGTAAPALNQSALTGHLTIVAQGSGDTTTTPPASWTERQDTTQATPTIALEVASRDSGFTGTTITFGAASSTTFCSHALELDSSPAFAFSETINNLADAHTKVMSQQKIFAETVDAFAETFEFANKPRWKDSETHSAGILRVFSDDALFLVDAFSLNLGTVTEPLTITASDNLNAWADAYLQTEGQLKAFADDLNLYADTYSQIEGQHLSFAESINNLADAYQQILEHRLTFAETVYQLADQCGYASKPRWQDAFSLSLSTNALTLSFAESINNWADAYAQIEGQLVPLTDNANNLGDQCGYSNKPRWQDSLVLTMGGIALVFSDDLNNWADAHTKIEGQLVPFSDDANNLGDFCGLGYGLGCSDSAVGLADSLSSIEGQLIGLSDDLLNLADSLSGRLAYLLAFSDDANNLADSFTTDIVSAVRTIVTSDDLNNWLDAHTKVLEYRITLTDGASNLADELALDLIANALSLNVSDNLNAFNDALVLFSQGFLSFSDALSQTDSCSLQAAGLLSCADQLGLSDAAALRLDYLLVLTEGEDNLADQIAIVNLSGSDTFLSDNFSLADSITLTLGVVIITGESMNNWIDSYVHETPHAVFVVKVLAEERIVRVP